MQQYLPMAVIVFMKVLILAYRFLGFISSYFVIERSYDDPLNSIYYRERSTNNFDLDGFSPAADKAALKSDIKRISKGCLNNFK